jgi:hypothetical protein
MTCGVGASSQPYENIRLSSSTQGLNYKEMRRSVGPLRKSEGKLPRRNREGNKRGWKKGLKSDYCIGTVQRVGREDK